MASSLFVAGAFPSILLFLLVTSGVEATVLTVVNKCSYTVWPGVLTGTGPAVADADQGFVLTSGQSRDVSAGAGWSGNIWGRTDCNFDGSGKGSCATGDCGNSLNCHGAGGAQPVSLAEFTLNADKNFYDVSLVNGYNIPLSIAPQGGAGDQCKTPGCFNDDIRASCPSELRVSGTNGEVVACKSACLAFGDAQYCCTGDHNTSQTCPATNYSKTFKSACPTAYSYAYDDASSTFSCTQSPNYQITFCPSA